MGKAARQRPARLAGKLLELADRYGKVTTAGVRIDQRFTHQQLSELIGTSRETLTKALNELRASGIVELAERRLVLRDQAALERMRRAR
jgi:CRP/FNR family transcriptional regulator